MKKILFLLLIGNTTFLFAKTSVKHSSTLNDESIYTFSITVNPEHKTKEVLSNVTKNLSYFNQYITEIGFEFSSTIAYTNATLLNLFVLANAPEATITSKKTSSSILSQEKVGGNNCEQAEILCSNGNLAGNSAGAGVQELAAANRGCLGIEHQSSWYYLNIQTGGSLTMMIDPAVNSDDYDFAIWGPFTTATAGANCPPVSAPIRCSFSDLNDRTGLQVMNLGTPTGCGFFGFFACGPSAVGDVTEGAGGDSFVLPLNVLSNQIYILLVDNFTASSNPYNMSFGGSAVLGCSPVVLPVEVSGFDVKRYATTDFLSFTVQSESRNDYFSIYHTTTPELNNWEEIERIYSKGDTQEERFYTSEYLFDDANSTNYYKLSQVDEDGQRNDFNDIKISKGTNNSRKLILRIVNLLGQEVKLEDAKGILLIIYSDGTSEKMFK